jgi:hypothetical protein
MANQRGIGSRSGPPVMDPVQMPRRITRADCPRVVDRVRNVRSRDARHDERPERLVRWLCLAVAVLATSLVGLSYVAMWQKAIAAAAAAVVGTVLETFVLVKLRFGR